MRKTNSTENEVGEVVLHILPLGVNWAQSISSVFVDENQLSSSTPKPTHPVSEDVLEILEGVQENFLAISLEIF